VHPGLVAFKDHQQKETVHVNREDPFPQKDLGIVVEPFQEDG